MRIMGIDPGLATTGYGVIDLPTGRHRVGGRSRRTRTPQARAWGTIDTLPRQGKTVRLATIHRKLASLLRRWKPDLVAVEQLFFAKNAKTAMVVGEARGVILLACAHAKVALVELTPLQVKSATTGYGHAEKRQMQFMVKKLLGLRETPQPDDAADALACAFAAIRYQGAPAAR